MSCTCSCAPCTCPQTFFELDENNIGCTLVSSLTGVADSMRDIAATMGARQYQIALVWTRWTGGARAAGNEEVIGFHKLLPTPNIMGLEGVNANVYNLGTLEVGSVVVSEISPRYSEELLTGRDVIVPTGDPIPSDVSFFWEIYIPRIGAPGTRRRFTPARPPTKHPTRFEWVIELARQSADRSPDEGLSYPLHPNARVMP